MVKENETEQHNLAPDEVDLVAALVKLIGFFVKNRIFLLAFILLGAGLGFGYFKFKSKVYSSKMVAECQSLQDSRVVELIVALDHLRENEDWDQLGNLLKMSPDEVKNLKKLEPLSNVAIDKASKGVDDYLLNTHEPMYSFSVIAKSKDNTLWPKLEAGIVDYLSENEYSKIRVNRFKESRVQLLEAVNKEIKKLDSGSVASINPVGTLNSKGTSFEKALSEFFKQQNASVIIDLHAKKQVYLDELEFSRGVRVVLGFIPYKNPIEPNLIPSVGIGALIGFGLGLLLIFFREISSLYRRNQTL